MLRKKYLLLVGFLIFICILSGSAVYIFTSDSIRDPGWGHWDVVFVSGLKFIDGGSGNDTVVATTINRTNEPLTITSGYISQSYWLDKGFVYQNHEQATELIGDLTIPINGTKDILLSLPKDMLIPGRTYAVELNTTQYHPPSVKYLDSENSFHIISPSETFTFYHMWHPNTPGQVEEGAITYLAAAFCDSNYADSMLVTVQNTGDIPLTITGGFVNGRAAEPIHSRPLA